MPRNPGRNGKVGGCTYWCGAGRDGYFTAAPYLQDTRVRLTALTRETTAMHRRATPHRLLPSHIIIYWRGAGRARGVAGRGGVRATGGGGRWAGRGVAGVNLRRRVR